MSKISFSFPKFKRFYHLLFSVSALCLSQEMLQALKIAILDDRLQTNRPRLARTRNTHLRVSTMLDGQDVWSQQAYDLELGLERLHQKVLQTIGAKLDVYSKALALNTSLTHLDLGYNYIGNVGKSTFLHNTHLTDLAL